MNELSIPFSSFQDKNLSIVEVILLHYIQQNINDEGNFTETDQQISKALNINQSSIPTLISKLVKLIYIEHIFNEENKRILRYVPVPKDSQPSNIKGFIYIMEDTNLPNFFKIGYSKDARYREGTLQAEKPSIHLIKKFVGSMEQEKSAHRYLAKYRVRGEWFTGLSLESIEKAIKKIIGIV